MLIAFNVPINLSLLNLGAIFYLTSFTQPLTVYGAFGTTLATRPQNVTDKQSVLTHF